MMKPFAALNVVLARPSHPGNIGSAARALKTMGFHRLTLVAPKQFPDPQAEALASGAVDVLAQATVVTQIEAALASATLVFGLSSRRRDLSPPLLDARCAAQKIAEHCQAGGEVALLFGNETTGLTIDELAHCDYWVSIPSNPAYPSLNLAAAVQLVCYEIRMALNAALPVPAFANAPASHAEVLALLAHLEQALVRSAFLDPARPGRLMQRLQRLFQRAQLEKEEVNILRGVIAALTNVD